ncbi:MAG: amino acid deaminase [Devosia sp.]|nr:amino acid deaminase [Devosia sp.]
MDLSSIRDTMLDGTTKGIPGTTAPFSLALIGTKGWNVLAEDLPLPLMVLKRSSLDHNAKVFEDYLTTNGLSFAPHGKTTMTPQIFAEQLAHGAWAMTAATVNQVKVMRRFGVARIILANQLLGRSHVQTIAAEINADPAFEFYCFVDSVEQFRNIERHLASTSLTTPIRLLVEIGVKGGRTGVRGGEAGLALIEAIHASDSAKFRFSGLAAFEGVVPGIAKDTSPVDAFAETIATFARDIPEEAYAGLDEFILTGGGSSYFDIVATHFKAVALPVPVRVVLRSGCYVTHDSGGYDAAQRAALADPHRHWSGELKPALEAWAYVQSMPELGLALLTMGKRDIPYDSGLPVPLKLYRPGIGWLDIGEAEVFATNDQHAYVRLGKGADWQVGDMVASGISHPCTAFDKWRFIPVINDNYDVIDGILTFF